MKALAVSLLTLALVSCAKGSNSSSASASATAAAVANNPASASDGASVYAANCASCHQSNGQGIGGAFPPLANNPTVSGNPTAVIAIVKNGLTGRISVNGQTYSGIMPPWGKTLSDDQVASVISYIRSSWGNRAPGVSVAQVQAIK